MKDGTVCLALLTEAYGGRGGIAQYNRDLTVALANIPSIGTVEILPRLAPEPPGPPPPKIRQHAARLNRLSYIVAACRLAATVKPDLVFCGHLFMAPLAAALAWRAKARLIVQAHGVEAWPRPPMLRRLAAERADLILAVSRDTRARVLDWANIAPERVRVVPNTVAEAFAPGDARAARARLGLEGKFAILTVGRLDARERYKGHDRVIALLGRLRAPNLEIVYLIAGDGDDRPRLEALAARHGVGGRVRFLGHIPAAELPDLYRAADIFVLPSSGEGFGIVLLEAMACGAPTLGLAVGGAVDALCDGELGLALDEASFPLGLETACRSRRTAAGRRGEELSRRVGRRFGRAAFEGRVGRALAGLCLN